MRAVSLDSIKIRSKTTVWKIYCSDEKVYNYLRMGGSIEDAVRLMDAVKVEKVEVNGNILLIEGANFIWRAVRGDTGLTYFNEANSYIGVGDGTASASASQTGLQGTNKFYKKVDAGYPTITDNKITFRATFGGTEANFAWNEWTVANGPSDAAINLNRKVESLGTKSSGTMWILQVELSLT